MWTLSHAWLVLADLASWANRARQLWLWYLRKRGGFGIKAHYWNRETQAKQFCSASLVERTLLDYYVEALRMQEREKMPEVGYCMDRRSLQHLVHYYNDDHVHSLVCFVCAQIFTDCSGSRENAKNADFEKSDVWRCHWYTPRSKLKTEIQYHAVKDTLLKWRRFDVNSFKRHLSLETFRERFCSARSCP